MAGINNYFRAIYDICFMSFFSGVMTCESVKDIIVSRVGASCDMLGSFMAPRVHSQLYNGIKPKPCKYTNYRAAAHKQMTPVEAFKSQHVCRFTIVL